MHEPEKPPERTGAKYTFMGSVSATYQIIGDHATMPIHQGSQSTLDVAALKSSLQNLYDQLGALGLAKNQQMDAQAAVHQATKAIERPDAKGETVVQQIEQISQNFKEVGVSIQQGSQVAATILNLANVVAPMVVGGGESGRRMVWSSLALSVEEGAFRERSRFSPTRR